jgi:hypothetical protein
VEVWIEKDALAGAIESVVVDEFGLDLYVSRGFSSLSYLESAAQAIRADGRPATVYVLTDFDPSGFSIAERIAKELPERASPTPVGIRRIACTENQVRDLLLPTRPVKKKDSRTKKFLAQYGAECAELDAIPPDTLRQTVRDALAIHMDPRTLVLLRAIEEEERRGIALFAGMGATLP